jgi:hypothetical protein
LAGAVSACGYKDNHNCNVIEKTYIEGKIYFEENNKAAGNADIAITCSHDGTDYTKTAHSINHGLLKGTYFVEFPQSQCEEGDEVTVVAHKGDLSGTVTDTVANWITQKCLDIDLARINVPLVPEFGTVVGMLTALGALGVFFVVRRK